MDTEISLSVIFIGGVAFFFKELMSRILWSIFIYLRRGELNHDNNEETPDKYLSYNPHTDSFSERWVIRYTISGVHWGFFYKGNFVSKVSPWIDWSDDRHNRFPYPERPESGNKEDIVKLIKRHS